MGEGSVLKSTKDIVQERLAKVYLDNFNHNYLGKLATKSTIISATGTGKSRICMLILEEIHKYFDSILFVGNSDRIRDVTWKDELIKWDKQHLLDKAEFVNYQTVYKWTLETRDLSKTFVVCDEIDYAIGTDQYSKFFYTYASVSMLGLTGYCAESKRDELNKVCPILVEYPFEQAVADGVINDVKFVFVKFDLDKAKTIEVKYKDKVTKQPKSFFQSENDAYDYTDTAFRIAYGKYDKANTDFVIGIGTEKELRNLEYDMKRKRDARLKLLYNGIAAQNVVETLRNKILSEPNNKVIVFSRYTEQCNRLSIITYHSKNTDEHNDEAIEAFNKGTIRQLGVCNKIDRGENLVGLNNIILESYTSSDTIIRQRSGRGARLAVTEVCTFYIMLPYFMKKGKDKEGNVIYTLAETQAVTWARNMLAGYNIKGSPVIDLRTIKE